MKHEFTVEDDRGYCGDAYCRGNCGTVTRTCKCGYVYTGSTKDELGEIKHVLESEGFYV